MSDTTPYPTVAVYGRFVALADGRLYYVQYLAVGDDHEEAASLAVRAWSGTAARLEDITTFDGPGRRWLPGAVPVEALLP